MDAKLQRFPAENSPSHTPGREASPYSITRDGANTTWTNAEANTTLLQCVHGREPQNLSPKLIDAPTH